MTQELKLSDLKTGTQVAYLPDHAENDITHPDVQFGFITSTNERFAFVRYWKKMQEGKQLRTTSCSEGTDVKNLRLAKSCSMKEVVDALNSIGEAWE